MFSEEQAPIMNTAETVLFVFLGWLLGILSPIIVDAIRKKQDIRDVRAALETEVHELQYRLACVAYFIEKRFGDVNRKFLEWLRPILVSYRGLNPSADILKFIETQLALTDDQIKALALHSKAAPEGGISLKKYQVPLLDSKISSLASLSTSLQNHLLELKTHLSLLNEEVDEARYYFRLTFQSSVTGENHDRVNENLTSCYKKYGARARQVADLIRNIHL